MLAWFRSGDTLRVRKFIIRALTTIILVALTGVVLIGQQEEELPDLAVASINVILPHGEPCLAVPGGFLCEAREASATVTLTASVENKGSAPSQGYSVWFWYRERGMREWAKFSRDLLEEEQDNPIRCERGLQARQEKQFHIDLRLFDPDDPARGGLRAGFYELRVSIDPQGQQERDLTNNDSLSLPDRYFLLVRSQREAARCSFEAAIRSSLVIRKEPEKGTETPVLYLGTDNGSLLKVRVKVAVGYPGNCQKSEDWVLNLDSGPVRAGPVIAKVIGKDVERVYAGSDDGNLYASHLQEGKKPWQDPLKVGAPIRSLSTSPDGWTIYVGADDGVLRAVQDMGGRAVVLWTFPTQGAIRSKAKVVDRKSPEGSKRMIYFGSDDGNLYALEDRNNSASLAWKFPTGAFIRSSPLIDIGDKGTMVYLSSASGRLYALEEVWQEGGYRVFERWSFPTGSFITSSPVLSSDKATIYVTSSNGNLYALRADNGELKWWFPTLAPIEFAPVLGPDGAIYVSSEDGNIYALDSAGGEQLRIPLRVRSTTAAERGPGLLTKKAEEPKDIELLYVGAGEDLYAIYLRKEE
jgi:hypothetical protein